MKLNQTKLKRRIRKKTNPVIVEIIQLTKKNPAWQEVSKFIAGPARRYASVNLFEIDEKTKAGDTIVILGKVLSKGELTKKLRICALGISESAKEKLKPTKSEFIFLLDEMKKNAKAEGIKILK
jgi:ribosomal protein L18E